MTPTCDPAVIDAILTAKFDNGGVSIDNKVVRLVLMYLYRTSGAPLSGPMRAAMVGLRAPHMYRACEVLQKHGFISYGRAIQFGRKRQWPINVNVEKLVSAPRISTWQDVTMYSDQIRTHTTESNRRYRARKKLNAKPVTSSSCACP